MHYKLILFLFMVILNSVISVIQYFLPELDPSSFFIYRMWFNSLIVFLMIFT